MNPPLSQTRTLDVAVTATIHGVTWTCAAAVRMGPSGRPTVRDVTNVVCWHRDEPREVEFEDASVDAIVALMDAARVAYLEATGGRVAEVVSS